MTKKKNKALALALAACMSFGTLGAFGGLRAYDAISASALDTTTQMTYPFENALKYAPSFKIASAGSSYSYSKVMFPQAKDFTNVQYLAVEIELVEGNSPWLIFGIHNGSQEYIVQQGSGNKAYLLKTDNSIKEYSINGTSITLTKGDKGTLIIPMSSMGINGSGTFNMSAVQYFFINTDISGVWNWELKVGSIGVYDKDPAEAGANLTTIVDRSTEVTDAERGKYLADHAQITFPSEEPEPEPPALNKYPFRTGEEAYYNTETWSGFVVDGAKSNQQTVKVKFDVETADFSDAEYLVVQYKNSGAPGLQYILNQENKNYSVAGKNGERIYFAEEGKTQSELSCQITNDHINVSQSNKMGALMIPMTSMKWNGTAGDLSKIDALTITTNSQYNGNFELVIGEIGMYDEDTQTFTKLLNLSTDKSAKFTVSSALDENKGTLTLFKPVLNQLGDASVDFYADKMTDASFTKSEPVYSETDPDKIDHYTYTLTGSGIWTGGSYGKRTATDITDSYGQQAVQLTSLGTNPYGDGYTAFDIAPAGGFSWANQKGVSFWARNDSDTEVSFNIEVNCRMEDKTGESQADKNNNGTRFNILQGNRFYLYDVNTGKTSIYMTRPTATLPVGFEGWVRIPFTAFERATWAGNGTLTKSQFMQEGTYVSYLAITVHAATYQNKSFSVNMFGAYDTTPVFESVFVKANGKTIPELMQLATLLTKEGN